MGKTAIGLCVGDRVRMSERMRDQLAPGPHQRGEVIAERGAFVVVQDEAGGCWLWFPAAWERVEE